MAWFPSQEIWAERIRDASLGLLAALLLAGVEAFQGKHLTKESLVETKI